MSWGTTSIDFEGSIRQAADALLMGPRLAFNAICHGLLPVPATTAMVAVTEGLSSLHWKVTGDALVRFARRSGPLTTKLGQVLATRTDLLPQALCARLEALYAGQRPMAAAELDAALARAFPQGPPFDELDRAPVGVGSIGQVHRATLANGARVIVKLLRPGIERQIERDLNALELLLGLALRVPGLVRHPAPDTLSRALRDLTAALRTETDLRREAMALEDFGRRLRSNPQVCVPRVYREWCSADALVMEELCGEPISRFRQRAANDPSAARRVADLALREILSQVFEHGHFHADPHAGNLLVLPDGRLGIIDLGLTGETKPEDRQRIARAVRAFMSGQPEALTRALLDFGVPPPTFRYDAFRDAVAMVVRESETRVMAQLTGKAGAEGAGGLEALVGELFRVASHHGLYVPPSTTLLIKAIVTIEGVARSLHPELNVVTTALPIVLRSMRPQWMRWDFWRDVAVDLAGMLDAVSPLSGPRS